MPRASQKNARVVITRQGGPEVLQWVEEDLSDPAPGMVRVKTLAAGVAYADILMRRGLYPGTPKFPFAPGYDLVGDIDALGAKVADFQVGQRVAALTMTGGYARFAEVPAAHLVPTPEGLDPAEAVSLVLNYVTAYQMIHRVAQLRAQQTMLVHSAAGGVGTAALQLGKMVGVVMYGTASKPKHSLVRGYGATPIDYRTEDFVDRIHQLVPEGLDGVLDPIGGKSWWRSYGCLGRGGSLVCYGVQAATSQGKRVAGLGFAALGIMKVLPDGRKASWFNVKSLRDQQPGWFREDLTRLFTLLATRKIEPVIAAKLPLREAARANEMLEQSQVSGKVVLLPAE